MKTYQIKRYYRLISAILFLSISFIQYSFGQPFVKKSTLSFESRLNHGESEDWIFSLCPSVDCIHVYFAGYTVFQDVNDLCPDPKYEPRLAIVGKYNNITNKLVWEREYYVDYGYGEFINIFESGDNIVATGGERSDPCSGPNNSLILVADKTTGNPRPGYPKHLNHNINGLENANLRYGPLTQVGNTNVMFGTGYVNNPNGGWNSVIVNTDENGNIIPFNNDPNNTGYFIGPANTDIRRMIKVTGHPDIKYAYIGYTSDNPVKDCLIGFLDINGKSMPNFPMQVFSESSLVAAGKYTDLPGDEPICTGIPVSTYENENEEAWDILQDGENLFITCRFDYFFDPEVNSGDNCSEYSNLHRYEYSDIALVKYSLSAQGGGITQAVNVGVAEAPEYWPDMELIDGRIVILGAKTTTIPNSTDVLSSGTLTSFNTNLGDKKFGTFNDDWNINCSFDITSNCDGDILVGGNNELHDEDYYVYKLNNNCQSKTSFNGQNDITSNVSINNIATWSSSRKVNATVIVKAGGELTIGPGAVIEFAASWDQIDFDILNKNLPSENVAIPKIQVQPGGKLILNQCTLRGLSSCPLNGMWDGIELQSGGEVVMNGATIMDAKYGIMADKSVYDQSGRIRPSETMGGALITSTNSHFENCFRGVHFAKCAQNTSHFTSTEFLCNSLLKDPSYRFFATDQYANTISTVRGTEAFVYSSGVDQSSIEFGSCSFTNSTNLYAPYRGDGIRVFNTAFKIGNSTFTNLYQGLYVSNSLLKMQGIKVDGSNVFTGNYIGVRMSGGTENRIQNMNSFTSKGHYTSNQLLQIVQWNRGIGVYNLASTRIKIADQNSFTSINTNQGLTDYGIYSLGTTDAPSLHKKNNFTDLWEGEKTTGKNKGLSLNCNSFTRQTRAWDLAGEVKDQGLCDPNQLPLSYTPDNTFNDGAMQYVPINHIANAANDMKYYLKDAFQSGRPIYNTAPPKVTTPTCGVAGIQEGCMFDPMLGPGNVNYYQSMYDGLPNGDLKYWLGNDLARYYSDAGLVSQYVNIISNLPQDGNRITYALYQLKSGDTQGANNTVNSLSASNPDNVDFGLVFQILLAHNNPQNGLSQLNTNEINTLVDLSDHENQAAAIAQDILGQYYAYIFPVWIDETVQTYDAKGKKSSQNMKESSIVGLNNPVEDHLEFTLTNFSDGQNSLTLTIHNVEGRLLLTRDFLYGHDKVSQNVTSLTPGFYLLSLSRDGKVFDSRLFEKL